MTSSLKSRFEFSGRRALFLSSQKAAVYQWRKGDLGSSFLFDANTQGREHFARYLTESPNYPLHILVDIFEEEFRAETIPHVFGGDRDAIVTRKKARLFRDTPYFQYSVQGRETAGRRDDNVLMSAITNPLLLDPWMQLLDDHKVPVAGVTSVPLFSAALVPLLPHAADNALLISLQSISGLRQTFIQKGKLRISRLVHMPRYGTEPYGPHIREEVEKIRRYLNSLRLASPEDPIDIYFLLTGELLEEVRGAYRDSALIRHHAVDLNDLLRKSGSARRVAAPFSDPLLAHQLLRLRPANAYATRRNRRYASLRTMRHGLVAAGCAFLFGGMASGGLDFITAMDLKQRGDAATSKTQFYSARYEMARERLPKTPVESADIQLAVEVADTLRQYKTSPREMMVLLGSQVQQHPQVQLDSVEWIASTNPEAKLEGGGENAEESPPPAPELGLTAQQPAYRIFQIALVKARLAPFDGDFRQAIVTIGALADALRAAPGVHNVQVLSLPLDISSDANLQGSSQATKAEAVFSMKIVLGIGNET
ncbi:MAG: hypothetical protein A3H91_00420 [Gammaproteobacteria bacterium RIFCSPLOWO2_02_FULL_61_13]|nr:MAG: hypothetical protein A3H91_00420 [Gammaproteobacteria bacterium RIFCSPLOWO2_02_FULL_61_13]